MNDNVSNLSFDAIGGKYSIMAYLLFIPHSDPSEMGRHIHSK